MAPICARNCATRSCCCCATRPVAARASSRGKSPSTSAPAPIAAIICNHSRRVLLVTLRLTVHPPLERSEEHTSELQSLTISYAVFCLEKKKVVTVVFENKQVECSNQSVGCVSGDEVLLLISDDAC